MSFYVAAKKNSVKAKNLNKIISAQKVAGMNFNLSKGGTIVNVALNVGQFDA